MKALIAAYARSPQTFARKGALAQVRPDTMAAQVVKGLLERTRLDPELIEDVIMGCAYPEGPQGSNIARIVALLAGLPLEVGGMTVNRFCGSSMSVIQIAAAQIEAGIGEAYLCAGVESMSMVPARRLQPLAEPGTAEPFSGCLHQHGTNRGKCGAALQHFAPRSGSHGGRLAPQSRAGARAGKTARRNRADSA